MKIIQKYIYVIFFSAALIMLAVCGSTEKVTSRICFRVKDQYQSNANEISIYDANDGNYYVFLPSYADMEQVSVVIEGDDIFSLDGRVLSNGMTCEEFELEKAYRFSVNNSKVATLRFYSSSNVAAMYINTVTGSMDSIHQDKEYEEYASITLYTPDGTIDYSDKMITVEGRGNTSWSSPKKSYTLTFRQSSPLLNMGSSTKWVLNSNGADMTNLHNKIVYSFADAIAEDPAWSPDCSYVEVYLNGNYAGLYLLCQKVDAGQEHLNLEREDYYFELTFSGRTWDCPSAFYVSSGRSLDILTPSDCNESQKSFIQTYIADFQTALYSDTGINPDTGLAWQDYIDMDSWAKKYLIEEVFSNFDGGQASQFFWLDTSEQKLHAGPCWDYDLTFGQFWGTTWSTTECLLAQRDWEEDLSWYHALCRKDPFVELVAEIYEAEFRPLLQEYIDEVIGSTALEIERAVWLDQLRWPMLYSETEWDTSADDMGAYLRGRMEFLDSVWIEDTDFCTITIWTDEIYNICVPTGSVCTTFPETHLFGASGPWFVWGTDEVFDVAQPIVADITITTQAPG